ncbi:MAG TPA: hypothetical protein VLA36_01565 [Longimicrobiales bacterium]|nr:hypothetical protein [Longimicrobiales bacterium]
MRFAYIDSQGNEVSIPSVDALALRIELGAIGPHTELYDAQADRWGPAHTHEIFHTLSRALGGEAGFVPPPPVSAQSDRGEPEVESAPEPVGSAEAEPQDEPPSFDLTGSLDLVDADGPVGAPRAPDGPSGDATVPPVDASLGFELTLTDAPGVASPEPREDGLDLGAAMVEPPPVGDGGAGEDDNDALEFGDLGDLALAGNLAGDQPLLADEVPAPSPLDGGLDLERPLSEFTTDNARSWMDEDAPVEDDGTMDFRPGSGQTGDEGVPSRSWTEPSRRPDGTGDAGGRRGRPEPRSRPSPPRRKRSFPAGAVLGVVGLAVVGGVAYFAWSTFLAGGDAEEEVVPEVVALPPVTIPDIPAEALPVMRELGEAAMVDMIDEFRRMQSEFRLQAEPREDWLAGNYLANASQFRDVQEYWEGIEAYVHRVRDVDTQVFHEQYVAELQRAGIGEERATMLLERADSGFLSTRDARFEAYALMDDLVRAALDLHRFLLLNEQEISFEPAAGGVSRDPVLEAVPSSPELKDQMWDMVDRITGALDALGTLDRVTTERLTGALFERVRQAGFQ